MFTVCYLVVEDLPLTFATKDTVFGNEKYITVLNVWVESQCEIDCEFYRYSSTVMILNTVHYFFMVGKLYPFYLSEISGCIRILLYGQNLQLRQFFPKVK